MTFLDVMDAIAVHALAAAKAAGGNTFTDVAVGFPVGKGRCVRIFYGGERTTERLGTSVLNAGLVAQSVVVRGYWPLSETATKRHRIIEGEMAAFVKGLRTRLMADNDLGGAAGDGLRVHLATTDQIVLGGSSTATNRRVGGVMYTTTDTLVVVDYDEFPEAR